MKGSCLQRQKKRNNFKCHPDIGLGHLDMWDLKPVGLTLHSTLRSSTPGQEVGNYVLVVTEFQFPKSAQSHLDITHYCPSSSGSMPIRPGSQPLYCNFFPRTITQGIVSEQVFTKVWTLNNCTWSRWPAPNFPPCFFCFSIHSSHLYPFLYCRAV